MESPLKMKRLKPSNIHVGNLVEIQVVFGTVPTFDGSHLFLCKLRSVCVMDRTAQEVSTHQSWMIQGLMNLPGRATAAYRQASEV